MRQKPAMVLLGCESCGTVNLGRQLNDGTFTLTERGTCLCGGKDFALIADSE